MIYMNQVPNLNALSFGGVVDVCFLSRAWRGDRVDRWHFRADISNVVHESVFHPALGCPCSRRVWSWVRGP